MLDFTFSAQVEEALWLRHYFVTLIYEVTRMLDSSFSAQGEETLGLRHYFVTFIYEVTSCNF